jgi:ligand-binding SRPBCC domain-containing protein
MKIFHLERRLWLPRPRQEVFEFFADALNLEEITPPWLRFRVITPKPIHMQRGAEIEYQLKVRGFPLRWKSRITLWEPPHRFVDEQIRGPYRVWIHEHRFTDESSGTLCEDSVQYAPFGGALINKLLVERDIGKIFAYRSQRLRDFFPEAPQDPLRSGKEGDGGDPPEPAHPPA